MTMQDDPFLTLIPDCVQTLDLPKAHVEAGASAGDAAADIARALASAAGRPEARGTEGVWVTNSLLGLGWQHVSHILTLIRMMMASAVRTPLLPVFSELEARLYRFLLFNFLFIFFIDILGRGVLIILFSREDKLYRICGIIVKVQVSAASLPWESESRAARGGLSTKVGLHGHKALSVPLHLVVVIQILALLKLSFLPAVDWDLVRAVMVVMMDVGVSSSTAVMTCCR